MTLAVRPRTSAERVGVGGATLRQKISDGPHCCHTPLLRCKHQFGRALRALLSNQPARRARSIGEEVGGMCERLTDVRGALEAYARTLEPVCLSTTQAETALADVAA